MAAEAAAAQRIRDAWGRQRGERPGAAAVLWGGEVVARCGDALRPWPIYSITKTFSAAAALRLAAAGRVDLDAPLEPDGSALPWASATLRQLLAHTAGVPNYSAWPEYHAAVRDRPRRAWSPDEFLERAATRPLDFAPGRGWSYSNTGYTLVRRRIERAAGCPLHEALASHVFEPAGLERTFALRDLADLERVAPGRSRFWGEPRDPRQLYDPGWCATGVLAGPPEDIARFFDRLLDGDLLGAPEREQMQRCHRVPGEHPPAVEPSYGLGLMADPRGPLGPECGHGGGGPGWSARALAWTGPDGRRAIAAVFCAGDEDHAGPLALALARALGHAPVSARAESPATPDA